MSDSPAGKRYLGLAYNKTTASKSLNAAEYSWSPLFDNVQVGGRNLFLNSKFKFDLTKRYSTYYMDASQEQTQGQLAPSIDQTTTFKGTNTLKIVSTFNGTRNNQKITFRTGGDDRTGTVDEMKNQSVMMSFWAKSTVANTIMSWRTGFRGATKELSIGTDWTYYSFQLIAQGAGDATNEAILHIWTAATVWVAFPKVERGTVSTDHTEAPEDVAEDINSKADAANTIQQLNALNEAQQIARAELEAKATAAELEKWVQAYNDFVNTNGTQQKEAEQKFAEISANVNKIVTDYGDSVTRWKYVNGYMDVADQGLKLGRDGDSTSILIQNNRISMISAGREVMSINEGVIQIDNGVFTKTLRIGRFREEQYEGNPDINVIRYVGP